MTKTKASDAIPTKTQTAQAKEGAQAAQPAAAPADGDAAAVVCAPAQRKAPAVQNPKHGGLYVQEGSGKPVAVHRTLHPDEAAADEKNL